MTGARRQWALVVVCTTALMMSVDTLVLNVALPTLARDLDASPSQLQWIVDTYILVFAGMLLVAGSLGDRYGRARILRIGLLLFAASSAAAAWATDPTTLIICRGVMGIGSAFCLPNSVAIITNVFTDARERGRALGVWAAIGGLGLALGPVVGGFLLSEFWWGSVFLVNVPIVLGAFLLGLWAIPESKHPSSSRFDVVGVVLSIVSVTVLVYAMIEAPTDGWLSGSTLALLAASFVVLGLFVAWEMWTPQPMLELHFFRAPEFSIANIAGCTSTFAFAGTLFVLTQLLQSLLGYTALEAGVRLIPLAVAFMVTGLAGPRIEESIGTRIAVTVGLVIAAIGMVGLSMVDEDSSYGMILLATLAVGGGYGIPLSPLTNSVVSSVPIQKAGVASGMNTTLKQVGNAMGVAVIGSLLVSGYRGSLQVGGLSARDAATSKESVLGAFSVAGRLGGAAGAALHESAAAAFADGLRLGMLLGAVVLGASAVLAVVFLPVRAERTAAAEDLVLALEVPIE